jgi:hypothetical protein
VTKPVLLLNKVDNAMRGKDAIEDARSQKVLQFEQEIYWILIMLLPVKPEPVQEEVVLASFCSSAS